MFKVDDVCKALGVSKTELGLVRSIFNDKQEWAADSVPRWALFAVSLSAFLSKMSFAPDKVSAILLYFSTDIEWLAKFYDNESKQKTHADREVSLIQVFDNRYVQLTQVDGQFKTKVLDLTTVDVVKSFPTPLLIVSIVAPKLWWLSVQALEGPSNQHSSEGAEKAS